MDILTIDATSYAARVAQRAAGELYALLAAGPDTGSGPGQPQAAPYNGPVNHWFDPAQANADPETINAVIQDFATYVAKKGDVAGETLFRHGADAGLYPGEAWEGLDLARQLAFSTFADAMRHVGGGLAVAQKAIADARREDPAGVVTTIAAEDSIFGKVEGLFDLRLEAIAASGLSARYNQAQAQERLRQRREQLKREQQQRNATTGNVLAEADAPAAAEPKAKRAKPKPKALGEAVAKKPVNAGGRNRKKSSAERRRAALAAK